MKKSTNESELHPTLSALEKVDVSNREMLNEKIGQSLETLTLQIARLALHDKQIAANMLIEANKKISPLLEQLNYRQ